MKDFVNLNWDWNNTDENIIQSPIITDSSYFLSDDGPVIDSSLYEAHMELESLMEINEEIEDTINKIQDYVSYRTMWQGRVINVMQDRFLAVLSKPDEDNEEDFYLEIAKKVLGPQQQKNLEIGVTFNWSFGQKESDTSKPFWKFELTQKWKPSEEAIKIMAAKMIEGFEYYYDDKE